MASSLVVLGGLLSVTYVTSRDKTGHPGWGAQAGGGLIVAVSDYRFAPPLLVRMLGTVLAGLGALVLLLAVLVAVLDLPGAVLTVGVVVAVGLVLAVGYLLSRRTALVSFDVAGYRVRLLRGAGVKQARWKDVEDAVTAEVSGHRCVVLRLRDGRTTTIPVDVLDATPEALVADLQAHLDRGHGYRRIS